MPTRRCSLVPRKSARFSPAEFNAGSTTRDADQGPVDAERGSLHEPRSRSIAWLQRPADAGSFTARHGSFLRAAGLHDTDSGELDVRRRDLGPALAVVRVAHDLDPLPAELRAYVEILRAPHAIDATDLTHSLISTRRRAVVALLFAAQERQRQRSNLEPGVAPTRIVETGLIVTWPGLSSAHANLIAREREGSSCLRLASSPSDARSKSMIALIFSLECAARPPDQATDPLPGRTIASRLRLLEREVRRRRASNGRDIGHALGAVLSVGFTSREPNERGLRARASTSEAVGG